MVSRTACDHRTFQVFWSWSNEEMRVRHLVKMNRATGQWLVCSDISQTDHDMFGIWGPPFRTKAIAVSEETGRQLYGLAKEWTNVGEEGRRVFPPGFELGFDGR